MKRREFLTGIAGILAASQAPWICRASGLLMPGRGGIISIPQVLGCPAVGGDPELLASEPVWVDNGDGTVSISFETDRACYAGVDYGETPGAYTESSFDYAAGSLSLALATSHTIEIPDPVYGKIKGSSIKPRRDAYRIFVEPPK